MIFNVSQLSSIVISEAANIRNSKVEMDLHSNTTLPQGESEPGFFCAMVFLLYIDVRQLEIDLFLLQSPVFPGVQGFNKPNLLHFPHLQGIHLQGTMINETPQ